MTTAPDDHGVPMTTASLRAGTGVIDAQQALAQPGNGAEPRRAAEAIDLCVRHDIAAIGLWRDKVAEPGLATTAATARAAGLHVSSLCRGGFFTHADAGRARGRRGGQPRGRGRKRRRSGPMR